jgi:hypothetical protein
MGFVVGLILFGVALWFLFRLKQQDLANCQQVLGLAPAAKTAVERGTTPEGFAFVDQLVLQGTMHGLPASLTHRTVRSPIAPKMQRKGSSFTVLSFTLARPARINLRIQPAGMLEGLESVVRGGATDRVARTGDATFDNAFVIYSDSPAAALDVLTPALRERLLTFRTEASGGILTDATPGKLASAFILGTFHIEGATASCLAFGSPTKATAEHVKAAAPLLLELITAAGQ